MERGRAGLWARRIAAGVAFLLLIVGAGISWRAMDLVESELLATGAWAEPSSVEVVSVGGGRIVLADEDEQSHEGVWGIAGPSGYGQVSGPSRRSPGVVERDLVVLAGSIAAGEIVAYDAVAYPIDPRLAHALPFEEIRVPGELGVNPAWLIDGEAETWVVFVHGKGHAGRKESLRLLPLLRRLGFPALVITYRNDGDGGAGEADRHTWGLEEWPDLDAALQTAMLRGAEDFVLVGYDMGASIVAAFLDRSELTGVVRGVVLDSPVLDLEEVADGLAAERSIPGFLAEVGKTVARIRFGLEWSELDRVSRAGQYDPSLPILLLQGTDDVIARRETADEFAAGLPHVSYELFGGAGHGTVWNQDPSRYEETVARFLFDVTPELLSDRDA
jgi:pimeloyl-ACP methyl ester carboxylesterase